MLGRSVGSTIAVAYQTISRDYAIFRVDFHLACRIALMVAAAGGEPGRKSLQNIVLAVAHEFARDVPDASTLQAIWAKKHNLAHGPDWIVQRIGEICSSELQTRKSTYEEIRIRAKECASLLKGTKLSSGKDYRRGKWKNEYISLYAACCLVATSIAAAFANQGLSWIKNNWIESYRGNPLNIPDDSPVSLSGLGASQIIDTFSRLENSPVEDSAAGESNQAQCVALRH